MARISAELNATGDYEGSGSFQLALANPPYYANFRIAKHFLLAGRAALKPGGQILLVTKLPTWYAQHMDAWYKKRPEKSPPCFWPWLRFPALDRK